MSIDDAESTMRSPRAGRDRSALYIVAALVAAWLGYLAFFGPRTPVGGLAAPELSDPRIGQADFAWSLETLDGETVDLGRYRGRTIVLNLWATWCGPCLLEMPSLRALAETADIPDLAVLAVSVEDRETLLRSTSGDESAVEFLRSPGLPPRMYLTDAIPATFLIAPDGRVVSMHVGAAQWDHPSVISRLKRLVDSGRVAQATR